MAGEEITMSDATSLRRYHVLEARHIEEARQAMREGHFIADADVERWLEDWRRGEPAEKLLVFPSLPPRR